MKSKLFFVIALAWLLAGCGVNPIDQAEAEAIKMQAEQDALDQVQERERATGIYMLDQAEREQTSEARVQAGRRVATAAGYAGAVAVAVVILGAGAGFALAAVETGRAAGRVAMVRANLIPLDRVTRQFPLLLSYAGKGCYTLTDANTGATMRLDTRSEPDRQLIATAGAVRLAGVVATEARRSTDAAGLALYNPVVIGAEVIGAEVEK